MSYYVVCCIFFFKQKTAYEMRISDWSSDVCSSDLNMLSGQGAKRSKMGGVRAAAEILNFMNSAEEEAVVSNLRALDADLAQRIVDEMFVFDNLIDIEDKFIQLILKETDTASLTIALQGAKTGRASGRERVCQYV